LTTSACTASQRAAIEIFGEEDGSQLGFDEFGAAEINMISAAFDVAGERGGGGGDEDDGDESMWETEDEDGDVFGVR
jgi:hypothetical protein